MRSIPVTIEPATFSSAPPINAQPSSTWRTALRALIWQTWREAAPVGWRLALLYLGVAVIVSIFDSPQDIRGFVVIANWPIGLIAGIFVFGAAHPGRTYRFLTHHGARPGLVWLAKVGVWSVWLGLLGLVAMILVF